MDLYVLTQYGRKAIPVLRKAGNEMEANMLEYLGLTEGATVEQLADAMQMDEKIAYDKLRSFSAKRLVWRKTTRLVGL
jgi:DNA-binding MarR family transcriptional regulator